MTRPEDETPGPLSSRATGPEAAPPRPAAPSWVDEVLRAGREPAPTAEGTAGRADDLRLPDPPERRPSPDAGGANDLRIPGPPRPEPAPTVITATAQPTTDDDWIARATGGAARVPRMPQAPAVTPPTASDPFKELLPQRSTTPSNMAGVPDDTAQKKLVAGVLAIVLGSLGVHKFYLGMNTPGVVMLAVNIGVWILALLLGLLTLGLGLFITVPLAALVSGAIGLLGLVEGVLYLTKSDGDFYRQYVLEKRPWL